MTEVEWLECDDFRDLLDFAKTTSRSSRRTLTLLAVAGYWRLTELLPDPVWVEAIAAAEAFADGAITVAQSNKARDRLAPHRGGSDQTVKVLPTETANALWHLLDSDQKESSGAIVLSSQIRGLHALHVAGIMPDILPYEEIERFWDWPEYYVAKNAAREEERKFLHDIFGNPFRKVKVNKKWRTDTVMSLARTMYDARDSGAMPILADALQDAGCDNDDVLNHCRGPGPHARGCWVVDALLRKG